MERGISVVLAHHNAPEKLHSCLRSLLRSQYSGEFEIIVVDDASSIDIQPFLKDLPVSLVSLKKNQGVGRARHIGAEHSKYDILFFADSDTELPPNALQRIDLAIRQENFDGVIGIVDREPLNPGFVAKWTADEANFMGMHCKDIPHQFFIGLCGAIKREVFFRFGGFYHRHIDDFEFGTRLPPSVRIKTDKQLNFKHHYSNLRVTFRKLFIRAFHFSQLKTSSYSPWFTTSRKLATIAAFFTLIATPLWLFPKIALAVQMSSFAAFLTLSSPLLSYQFRSYGLSYLLKSIGTKFALSLAVMLGALLGKAYAIFSTLRNKLIEKAGPLRIYLRPHSPTYAILYVTSRCNSRCSYCFQWEILNEPTRVKAELSTLDYERLAKSMGPMEHITLGGGEPFLRKDLADIAYAFYKHTGVRNISIPSNGTRPDLIATVGADILARCPKATIKLSLSIDGVEDEHDRLRGAIGNYERIIQCDQILRNLRKKHSNLYYIINTCYNSKNENTIYKTLEENRKRFDHDIQVTTFIRGSVADPTEKQIDINTYFGIVDYLQGIHTIERKNNSYWMDSIHQGLHVESRQNIRSILSQGKTKYTCTAGRNLIVIDDIGNVNPCEILPAKFGFGNLKDHNMDVRSLMRQAKVKRTQNRIRKEKCHCTWECAQLNSIAFSLKGMARTLTHAFNLEIRRRRQQKLAAPVLPALVPQPPSTLLSVSSEEHTHPMVLEADSTNPFSSHENEDERSRKRARWLRPVRL